MPDPFIAALLNPQAENAFKIIQKCSCNSYNVVCSLSTFQFCQHQMQQVHVISSTGNRRLGRFFLISISRGKAPIAEYTLLMYAKHTHGKDFSHDAVQLPCSIKICEILTDFEGLHQPFNCAIGCGTPHCCDDVAIPRHASMWEESLANSSHRKMCTHSRRIVAAVSLVLASHDLP